MRLEPIVDRQKAGGGQGAAKGAMPGDRRLRSVGFGAAGIDFIGWPNEDLPFFRSESESLC